MTAPKNPDFTNPAKLRLSLLHRRRDFHGDSPIGRRNSTWAPLSFSQERLWFLDQLDPGTPTYNLPILLQISGPLKGQVLVDSFQEILRRHEIMRTAFRKEFGRPIQVVLPDIEFVMPTIDLTSLSAGEQKGESLRLAHELATRSFAPSDPPLIRSALFAFNPTSYQLLVVMHHIISDSWSLFFLIRELTALYEASLNGRISPLAELPIQYGDFAAWQREQLEENLQAQLAWWRDYLIDAPTILELPTDRPRPPIQSFRGSTYQFCLNALTVEPVSNLARREGATLFMALLAVWAIVLNRHTSQDDMLIGIPIAGRNRAELNDLIGSFANIIVLRVKVREEANTFTDLLRYVREIVLGVYAHQDLPFELLVDELVKERTLAHWPLAQTMFAFQNAFDVNLSVPELILTPLALDQETPANFDLTLVLQEQMRQVLECNLEYSTDLFNRSTIMRIAEHFKVLIEEAGADSARPIRELSILTESERFQLLIAWNDTEAKPLIEPLLHQRFQRRVALCPNDVAVVCGERRLTFAELSIQAAHLAASLVARGVGPDVIVGLRLRRSPELIVAALAVLVAGGAYLPLDYSYPTERQAWILSDSGTRLVLTSEAWPEAPTEAEVFILPNEMRFEGIENPSPLPEVDYDNLAYVLYTSGSTGAPKGVMVQHRALARYLDWALQTYEVEMGQGAPVHSSPAFDITVTSWWAPLLAGRTITLLPEETGIEALAATIHPGANFSLVKLTPAHVAALSQLVPAESMRGWTRTLVIGGEALRSESLTPWRKYAPEMRIFNEYGPTETVVGCSAYEIPKVTTLADPMPIGRPISGARLYVLDWHLGIVPIGVVGELFIGGEGVTLGYRNRPSLTAERFLPDPHSNEPGSRMYRSGDLVRWRVDGNLEYLSRADSQIKIRGFRIEPEEIAAALSAHRGVRDCVVIARANVEGELQLIAYVKGTTSLHAQDLRNFLRSKLPEVMIPTEFIQLDSLPMTPSGKIDKEALPQPGDVRRQTQFVPPRTIVEERIAKIWAELLQLERVGVNDHFFELGGHSLIAARALSRLNESFDIDLPLQALFASPTVAELAARIEQEASLTALPDLDRIVAWEPSIASMDSIYNEIDSIYDAMIALVQSYGRRPGLREALRPLQERLQALQEIEAQEIVERYDSHFQPDYERAQTLLVKARELIGKK